VIAIELVSHQTDSNNLSYRAKATNCC
jgi:hypothetical protein